MPSTEMDRQFKVEQAITCDRLCGVEPSWRLGWGRVGLSNLTGAWFGCRRD